MATPEDMRADAEHIRMADQFVEVCVYVCVCGWSGGGWGGWGWGGGAWQRQGLEGRGGSCRGGGRTGGQGEASDLVVVPRCSGCSLRWAVSQSARLPGPAGAIQPGLFPACAPHLWPPLTWHCRPTCDPTPQVPGGKNSNNYANVQLITAMAMRTGVDAVWPGW